MYWSGNDRRPPSVSPLAVALAEALTQARRQLLSARRGQAHDITNDSYIVPDPYSVVSDAQLADGRTVSKHLLIASLINLQLLVAASNVWIVRNHRVINPQTVQNLIGSPVLGLSQ